MVSIWMLLCTAVVFVSSQHIWNIVNTNAAAKCKLATLFENSFYFVDVAGKNMSDFQMNETYKFGLVLEASASFNMIYSIVCMSQDCTFPLGPCPRTAFVISASGPGRPTVDIIHYQNASGTWNVSQTGDMFFDIYNL